MVMPTPETVVYKSVGGHDIRLDVYRPGSAGPAPVVVWTHGGCLIMGSRKRIDGRPGILDMCLKLGMAVVAIDYRLAPETMLLGILSDLKDAFAWVRDEGPAHGLDSGRIGVVGHSAGGYLALMSAFIAVPAPRAVVSFYGYGDIDGDWYAKPDAFYNLQPPVTEAEARAAVGKTPLSEPDEAASARRMRYYLWTRQRGLWPREVTGRDPGKARAAFDRWCPVRNVAAWWPPTLLLHGTADTDVPYAQSTAMLDALTLAASGHRLITVKGGPHAFERGVTIADMTARRRTPVAQACADSVAFLAEHLGAN